MSDQLGIVAFTSTTRGICRGWNQKSDPKASLKKGGGGHFWGRISELQGIFGECSACLADAQQGITSLVVSFKGTPGFIPTFPTEHQQVVRPLGKNDNICPVATNVV